MSDDDRMFEAEKIELEIDGESFPIDDASITPGSLISDGNPDDDRMDAVRMATGEYSGSFTTTMSKETARALYDPLYERESEFSAMSMLPVSHKDFSITTEALDEAMRERLEKEMEERDTIEPTDVDITVTTDSREEMLMLERLEHAMTINVELDAELPTDELMGHPKLGEALKSATVRFTAEGGFDPEGIPPFDDEERPMYYEPDPKSHAGRVCQAIRDRIREIGVAPFDEFEVTQLVLGEPQVNVLRDHIESNPDAPSNLKDWFGMEQVIEVPGPMMHPVPPEDCDVDE